MKWPARLIAAMAALTALGVAAPVASRPADSAQGWSSSADASRKLTPMAAMPRSARQPAPGEAVISVDPRRRFQSMVGFGAAMTDASALLLMDALDTQARTRLLRELFGRDGLAISFLRVPIGASDFSPVHYSLDDMPPGTRDDALAHFSMAGAAAAQIPMLRAAKGVNPGLSLMASPWSAPGWMKTSDSLIKGRLRPDAYPAFAQYFSRYLAEMARRGLPVGWISVQNEPHFEPADYPGMRMDPGERAAFIGGHLGPLLARRGQRAAILDWDHNWDQPESPLAVLGDPRAARYISGVAWHCYAGDVGAMERGRAAFPAKDVFFTECSGGNWAPDWGGTLGWMSSNLVIAASRAGSRGTLLWNLALDENHGPHKGGCGDCRGVVTIDRVSGTVTRNVEYYVLAHASRFVRPGARRIASSESADIANVAFRNPDGTLVLIAHNRGKAAARFAVRSGAKLFTVALPAGEVATFTWRE